MRYNTAMSQPTGDPPSAGRGSAGRSPGRKPRGRSAILPPMALEMAARLEGFRCIAGGDEAGRGPWAGPVVIALVVLPEQFDATGIDDSKRMTPATRQAALQRIRAAAEALHVEFVDAEDIDRMDILRAIQLAYVRGFERMRPQPDLLLLDHVKMPPMPVPVRTFIRGESKSASIAAASIVAKEARDAWMVAAARRFPGYGFESHMGYGTPEHQEALRRLGPCPLHRHSFGPIKALSAVPHPTLPGLD